MACNRSHAYSNVCQDAWVRGFGFQIPFLVDFDYKCFWTRLWAMSQIFYPAQWISLKGFSIGTRICEETIRTGRWAAMDTDANSRFILEPKCIVIVHMYRLKLHRLLVCVGQMDKISISEKIQKLNMPQAMFFISWYERGRGKIPAC